MRGLGGHGGRAFALGALAFVGACGGSGPAPTTPAAPVMGTFEVNGFGLAGAEYWPYVGAADIRYPEDVLWGFYPEKGVVPTGETDPNPASATPPAVACATRAHAALRAFLASDPPELRRIADEGLALGYTKRFYLWTNDYTKAATPFPPGVRPARLWYWKRKTPAPPKPAGYWKWESTVTQDGQCHLPDAASIREAFQKGLDEVVHQGEGGNAPTPYTADQIRDATRVGRSYEFRVEVPGQPTKRRLLTFTKVDDAGGDVRTDVLDDDGKVTEPSKTNHAAWDELRRHAEFPKSLVTISDAPAVTLPAGTFECLHYAVKEEGSESHFFFAKSLPGAPVLFYTEKGGARVMTTTLLRHTPGAR